MPLSSTNAAQSIVRPGVCTSATKPASPFDGQMIYMSDVDQSAVWDGSAWIGMDPSRDRNVIINGAMQVDQRNNGASYTMVNATYGLDRWAGYSSAANKYSVQRLSTTPPAGFAYYQRVTSLAATADTSGAYYTLFQSIEGFNAAKFAWGTANAKSVLLSFWVRSSLTGTFGGGLRNAGSGGFYSYAFTYTVNAANTWEYKTISITGSTAGTWDSTNGIGITLFLDLGTNASDTQAAGSWANVNKLGANGCVRLIGTNAATLDFTGVQLEAGAVATPFEFEDYGTTLAKCQRYYYKSYSDGTNPGSSVTATYGGLVPTSIVDAGVSTYAPGYFSYPVAMRTAPTLTYYDAAGNLSKFSTLTGGGLARTDNVGAVYSLYTSTSSGFYIALPGAGTWANIMIVAAAEL